MRGSALRGPDHGGHFIHVLVDSFGGPLDTLLGLPKASLVLGDGERGNKGAKDTVVVLI